MATNRGGRPRKPGSDDLVQTTVRLHPMIHAALLVYANSRSRTIGEVIGELIEEHCVEVLDAISRAGLATKSRQVYTTRR